MPSPTNSRLPAGLDYDCWCEDTFGDCASLEYVLRHYAGDPIAAARWHVATSRISLTEYLLLTTPHAIESRSQTGVRAAG
jgi:hypothetical protein